jgi:hypothetical protein
MSLSGDPTFGTRPGLAPFDRPLLLLAIATGAAWTIGVTLVAIQAVSDPVGMGYDAANRFLTLPLLLLVTFAALLRTSPPGGSWRGVLVLVGGSVLMLAGNVLKFWAVLLSDSHTEKTAVRLGESAVFWGSLVGWFIFLPGLLITVVAAAMWGGPFVTLVERSLPSSR